MYNAFSFQIKELDWLPYPLPPQCKIIVTSLKSDLTYRQLSGRGDVKTVQIPPLKDSEHRRAIVRDHLALHCKALNGEQLERIVSCRHADKPLFLSILASELRVCGGGVGQSGDLDELLEGYLESMSVRDLWGRIIQRWVREYGWTLDALENSDGNSDNSQGKPHILV